MGKRRNIPITRKIYGLVVVIHGDDFVAVSVAVIATTTSAGALLVDCFTSSASNSSLY